MPDVRLTSTRLGPAVLDPTDESALVEDATRAVLAAALPEESGVFEKEHAQYVRERGTVTRRTEDEPLAFGAEAVLLLTPYVVAAVTAAVRFLASLVLDAASDEVKPAIGGWLRRLVHAGPADAPPPAPLPADAAARVHEVTLDVCLELGLDPTDARLVSDAVTGRLSVAA